MSELYSEYLSVRCSWLYVIIMLNTCFRVNLYFNLQLPECQGTPCSKQVRHLKCKRSLKKLKMRKFQSVLKVSRKLCEDDFVKISFSCLWFASISVFGPTLKKYDVNLEKFSLIAVYRSFPGNFLNKPYFYHSH